MRKKSTYLILLAIIAIVVAFAYILNIVMIKNIASGVVTNIQSPWILALGAAAAFILTDNKYYWFMNIACAVLAAVILQIFIYGGMVTFWAVLYKTLAFLTIVYILNLAKILITR